MVMFGLTPDEKSVELSVNSRRDSDETADPAAVCNQFSGFDGLREPGQLPKIACVRNDWLALAEVGI
jgi:hypothetical protein